MGSYATDYTDVQPRLGGRTLTTTSSVTQAQTSAWITEAEAVLNGHLKSIGLTTPVTGTDPIAICKTKVVSQVAARVINAWEVGTRLESSQLAVDLMKEWDDFITLIQTQPGRAALMLGQGFGDTAGKGALRSYQTDRAASDSKSIAAGDFDPVFTRDKKW